MRIQPLAVLLIVSACASAASGELRRSLGNASAPDMFDRTRRVFALNRFEVDREENTPQLLLMQSRWLQRDPFQDEKDIGVTAAENRITVTGRFRLQTEQGPLYALDLVIERRVNLMGQEGWVDAPGTRASTAHADSIGAQLQRELTIGTRRF